MITFYKIRQTLVRQTTYPPDDVPTYPLGSSSSTLVAAAHSSGVSSTAPEPAPTATITVVTVIVAVVSIVAPVVPVVVAVVVPATSHTVTAAKVLAAATGPLAALVGVGGPHAERAAWMFA